MFGWKEPLLAFTLFLLIIAFYYVANQEDIMENFFYFIAIVLIFVIVGCCILFLDDDNAEFQLITLSYTNALLITFSYKRAEKVIHSLSPKLSTGTFCALQRQSENGSQKTRYVHKSLKIQCQVFVSPGRLIHRLSTGDLSTGYPQAQALITFGYKALITFGYKALFSE